jgi:hypothetical protein
MKVVFDFRKYDVVGRGAVQGFIQILFSVGALMAVVRKLRKF